MAGSHLRRSSFAQFEVWRKLTVHGRSILGVEVPTEVELPRGGSEERNEADILSGSSYYDYKDNRKRAR